MRRTPIQLDSPAPANPLTSQFRLGIVRVTIKFVVMGVIGALVAVSASFLYPAKYSSEAAILIESPDDLSAALSLSQFSEAFSASGLGGLSGRENGYTYIEVLRGRTVLEDILKAANPGTTPPKFYAAYFCRGNLQDGRTWETAVLKLRKAIALGYSTRDHILRISVRHRNAEVAAGIADLLIKELASFNANVRSTRAHEAAQFIQERFRESEEALGTAEQKLLTFQETNVRIGNAPELRLAQHRLERNVRLDEEVYDLLAKQLEAARIQEKRETPVFTVVDHPTVPPEPERMPPIVAAIVGFALAIGASVLMWWFVERARVRLPTS